MSLESATIGLSALRDAVRNTTSFAGMDGTPGKKQGLSEKLSLWKKIPQFLNLFQYQRQPEKRDDILDYEPIHLHVTPSEVQGSFEISTQKTTDPSTGGGNALKPDNFRFLLEQVPAIRTIEFSGRVDPFKHPYLMQFVDAAYRFNGAESTIFTDGLHIAPYCQQILQSKLRTLVVRMHATKPSQYGRLTGLSPTQFLQVHGNLMTLLKMKRELNSTVEIEVALTVDLHSFRDIPDMVMAVQAIGVDGLRFENYLSPDPGKKSDRTLYTNQRPVVNALKWMKENVLSITKMPVTLPVLLDENMGDYRHCLDPFTTVSVDADFNISGCSRRLLHQGQNGKIWDSDFWNNDMYQWLRSIHGAAARQAKGTAVPSACQGCPRNMPARPEQSHR